MFGWSGTGAGRVAHVQQSSRAGRQTSRAAHHGHPGFSQRSLRSRELLLLCWWKLWLLPGSFSYQIFAAAHGRMTSTACQGHALVWTSSISTTARPAPTGTGGILLWVRVAIGDAFATRPRACGLTFSVVGLLIPASRCPISPPSSCACRGAVAQVGAAHCQCAKLERSRRAERCSRAPRRSAQPRRSSSFVAVHTCRASLDCNGNSCGVRAGLPAS